MEESFWNRIAISNTSPSADKLFAFCDATFFREVIRCIALRYIYIYIIGKALVNALTRYNAIARINSLAKLLYIFVVANKKENRKRKN